MTVALASQPVTALCAATVNNIRLASDGPNTRVVLDLDEQVEYKLFPLRQPERLVIDIRSGRLADNFVTMPSGSGVVAGIRAARRGDNDLRIVLDLSTVVRPRATFAGPAAGRAERLVIDLEEPGSLTPVKIAKTSGAPARDVVIAIDPGHGGKDPGATGRNRTREKDVVLSISRKLARRIDAEPGMRSYLVRTGDQLVNLRERMERARRKNADMFVSIHADAFNDKRANGSSVYALSLRGASNEAARRLAATQNAADLIGGVTLSDKDAVLASVLMDLSQNAAISASVKVGKEVLNELAKVGRVHKRRVQQAEFAVLKSPDVPSILVETAFISNPDEERKLRDAAHQERLAAAVFTGLRNYFRENAPPETSIAMNVERRPAAPVRHVISRGDTLSEIAERYNVRLSRLRALNKIKGDTVRIGQVLTIPVGS